MRANPRRRIDQQAAEAARALALRREAVLPSDHALEQAAIIRCAAVDAAVVFFRAANAGTPLAALLDGPPGEGERP